MGVLSREKSTVCNNFIQKSEVGLLSEMMDCCTLLSTIDGFHGVWLHSGGQELGCVLVFGAVVCKNTGEKALHRVLTISVER